MQDNSRFGEGSSRVLSRAGRKANVANTFEESSTTSSRRRTRSSSRSEDHSVNPSYSHDRPPSRIKRIRRERNPANSSDPVVESSRNAQAIPIILPPLPIFPNLILNLPIPTSNSPVSNVNHQSSAAEILPPIDFSREDDRSNGQRVTLPPIRSVLPIDLPATPVNNNSDTNSNVSEAAQRPPVEHHTPSRTTPHANDRQSTPIVVDLTIPPPNNNNTDVIVIEDDPGHEGDVNSSSPQTPTAAENSQGLQLKCAICLEPPMEVSATTCGHIFCRKCILQAIRAQKVCSLCRRTLTKRQIKRLEFKVI